MALPEILTVEDLFSSPVRAGASISPDGTKIAYLAPWKNRLNVWVQGVDSDDDARCVTADDNRSVFSYHWTDDPRWLLYTQDDRRRRELARVSGRLGEPGRSRPSTSRRSPARRHTSSCPPDVPARRSSASTSEIWRCSTPTNSTSPQVSSPCSPRTPETAPAGSPAATGDLFALTVTADGDVELSSWDATTGTLRSIAVYDGADYTLGVFPIEVTPDGKGLWIGSNRHADRTTAGAAGCGHR